MIRHLGLFPFILLLPILLLVAGCSNLSINDNWNPYYASFAQNQVPVCYGYGCKRQSQISLTDQEWAGIEQLFAQGSASAEAERVAIAEAIAQMETLVGQRTGTWKDKAKNSGMGQAGQMDCIDESTNTTAYLRLFAYKGWLKWHQVEARTMRSYILVDVHWTAVIKDIQSQQLYAVDSWFRDNGRPPLIMRLQAWLARMEEP